MEINFTNIDVKRTMPKQFRISADMELLSGLDVIFTYSFGCDYKPGDDITDRVDRLQEELQDALDNFAAEQELVTPATNKLNALKSKLTIPQL